MVCEAAPPKDIKKIHRKNLDSDSTFWRVRLICSKEKINVDKLLDALELAIAFLAQCKTPEGREHVITVSLETMKIIKSLPKLELA